MSAAMGSNRDITPVQVISGNKQEIRQYALHLAESNKIWEGSIAVAKSASILQSDYGFSDVY